MQKNIIALAIAAAFAAPAAAMAEATFYGSMDGGLRHQTNDAANRGTTDTMQMGQYNTARWGFKVSEDLGDGLKTNVVLETSFGPAGVGGNSNLNSAALPNTQASNNFFGLIFDRQATLGLEGSMGKFDMGWNYTTAFKTMATYDPMNYKFLAVAGAKSSGVRRLTPAFMTTGKSEVQDRLGMVTYENKMGDVGIRLEYDVNNDNKAAPAAMGAGRAIGVTYAGGPINVGFAYSAIEPTAGYEDKVTHITAGAGFGFGDGKVSVGMAKNTMTNPMGTASGGADEVDSNMWGGVSYKVTSATEVTFAYYKNTFTSAMQAAAGAIDSTKNTMMLAATYALSKKTNLYIGVDKSTANAGSTGAKDVVTSGTSLGLNTAF